MSTQPPDSDARRFSQLTTQPPNSEAQRFSSIATQNPGNNGRLFSDFSTQEPDIGGHRFSDFPTQEPDNAERNPSNFSTEEPNSSARHFSQMNTQEPPSNPARMGAADDGDKEADCLPPGENTANEIDGNRRWGGLTWNEALLFGYNFISEHTDVVLRKVLKVWDKKISGSKTERVARAFLVYRLSLHCGDMPAEVFSRCSRDEGSSSDDVTGSTAANRRDSLFKDFETWLQPKRLLVGTLRRVPRDEDMMRTFRSQERDYWREREIEAEQRRHMAADGDLSRALQRATGVAAQRRRERPSRSQTESLQSSEPFTISLFTRLCLILRDDEVARDALIASGQPLEREQQDRRINRESFWETIAERFNDPSLAPHMDLRGILENFNPSIAPREHVAASRLRTIWYNMRGPFSLSVRNYQKSGQNNPTLDGFLSFVDKADNGDLFAISRRKVVMFVVMGMGSDNPRPTDAELLNLTVKVIPHNAGFDEAGSSINGGVESEEGSRKRARMSTDTQELCDTFKGLIGEFRTFNGMVSGGGQVGDLSIGREEGESSHADAVLIMEHRARAVEVLRVAHKDYRRAKEEIADENDPLLAIAKEHYELTREQYDATFRTANTTHA